MTLIVLDRDGVINEDSDEYIKSVEEWVPIEDSVESIARLNNGGYRVIVATNQSGIARGLLDLEALTQIHQKMHRLVQEAGGSIEAVFFCPHGPDDACECRKPKPGLLHEIARRTGEPASDMIVVGDSLRDIEAAWAVGARPVLVRTGKGERTLTKHRKRLEGVEIYDCLASFALRLVETAEAAD